LSELAIPIVYQLCIGGIGGFFVGYLVKKVAKIVETYPLPPVSQLPS